MGQQQQEVERLNKELLEQRAELALLRSTLESKEMVRLNVKTQQNPLAPPSGQTSGLTTTILDFTCC